MMTMTMDGLGVLQIDVRHRQFGGIERSGGYNRI